MGFSPSGLGSAALEGSLEEPSSIAVGLFNQGYRHCQAAHRQRSRDIKGAQRKFQLYLDYFAQATAEDVRVATTSASNIDRSITYCNQVAADLTRVLATPTLEKSYASCQTAKQFLRDFDLSNAEKYFNAHVQLQSKALQMSPDLLSKSLNQTWIQEGERLCKRVKLNIKRVGNRLARINLDMPAVKDHLNSAVQQCSVARQGINDQAEVAPLEGLLGEVQLAIRQAQEYESVWTYARSKGDHDNSKSLLKSLAVSNWCEHQLSKDIANLIKRKQNQALLAEQEALKQKNMAQQRLLEAGDQNMNISIGEIDAETPMSPLIAAREVGLEGYEELTLGVQPSAIIEEDLWGIWIGFEPFENPLPTRTEKPVNGADLGEYEQYSGVNAELEVAGLAQQKPGSELVSVNSNTLARSAPPLSP
ncbi:MAG: hypothetical protein COB51_03685 [Moraxellaceae bacterium]|nr:MAG: hypothetical protein COB51_03685 [Moraxellaceae bacterium]